MIRHTFFEALQLLQEDLVSMGAAVEKQIDQAVEALKNRDVAAAQEVTARDNEIDRIRYDLEERCIELFATQNPLASDLRTVTSALIVAVVGPSRSSSPSPSRRRTSSRAGSPPSSGGS